LEETRKRKIALLGGRRGIGIKSAREIIQKVYAAKARADEIDGNCGR